jgi:hypothetical protein
MGKKQLPDWLETLYNVNPCLAERAEKHLNKLYSEDDLISFAAWCIINKYNNAQYGHIPTDYELIEMWKKSKKI